MPDQVRLIAARFSGGGKVCLEELEGRPYRQRLAFVLSLCALTLLLFAVLVSRTMSVASWDSGSGQVGRWAEAGVCLCLGLLGLRFGVRMGVERLGAALAMATVALQIACIVGALFYASGGSSNEPLRLASMVMHCSSLATGMLACALVMSRLSEVNVAAGVVLAFALANLVNGVRDFAFPALDPRALCSSCVYVSMGLVMGAGCLLMGRMPALAPKGARDGESARAMWRGWFRNAHVLVGIAALSLLYGLVVQVGEAGTSSFTPGWVALIRCAVLLACVLPCWYDSGRLVSDRLFVAFIPLVSTVILFLPLMGGEEGGPGQIVSRLVFTVFQALVWAYCMRCVREGSWGPALAVFGVAFGCQHLLVLVGRVVGVALARQGVSPAGFALAMLWALGLVMFVCYRMEAGGRELTGSPQGDAAGDAPSQNRGAEPFPERRDAIARLAHGWGLSPREEEVARYIDAGVARSQIATAMCVTEETVKTYVRRLYAKAGVHSRHELICLLEGARSKGGCGENETRAGAGYAMGDKGRGVFPGV